MQRKSMLPRSARVDQRQVQKLSKDEPKAPDSHKMALLKTIITLTVQNGELKQALKPVAAELRQKNPLDAPWADDDWDLDAHIINPITLTVAEARAILEVVK